MNPAGFVRLRRTKIYKHIMLLPLKAADAVITFTEKEKDGLSSVGIENRKIRTIPMGIRFGDFSQIQKKVNPNEIVFGYLGKISPLKGAHRLVEPLSRIMNEFPLRVRVIFAGSLGLQQYAKSVLDNLAKCPNFKYIGPLRLHEVNDFFRRCDIVLVPSLMEGTPATPLEAMAAGKCVIASNIFPINEFIEHGKSGMLAESERQFYEYAKRMILHPNLIETIGKNARNKVSLHSWNHVVAAFTETYFRICQS